jgi:hypothetical protein
MHMLPLVHTLGACPPHRHSANSCSHFGGTDRTLGVSWTIQADGVQHTAGTIHAVKAACSALNF